MAERWIAVSLTIFDHDIVGPGAAVPPPANRKKRAWPPMGAWQWLIAEAAYAPRSRKIGGMDVPMARGQLVVAQRHLCEQFNWGRHALRGFLARLQRAGMIRVEAPSGTPCDEAGQFSFSLVEANCLPQGVGKAGEKNGPQGGPPWTRITICNYDKFQAPPQQARPGVRPPPGPHPAQDSQDSTVNKRLHRSLDRTESGTDAREDLPDFPPSGTDCSGERLPFTEAALADCEAMGFTRQTVVEHYYARTKGRRVRDPSAYLVAMVADMAAKARGVSVDAMRATLSKNADQRAEGYQRATSAPPMLSASMYAALDRRCERAGQCVEAMLAAWGERVAGVRVLNPDANADAFCSTWLRSQKRQAANRA